MEKNAAKSSKASARPRADSLPALVTQNGQLVIDAAAQARAKGLSEGCQVIVHIGSEKQGGAFLGVAGEQEARVKFANQEFDDIQVVPLDSLELVPVQEEKKSKAVRAIDTRRPGQEWMLMSESQVELGVFDFVKAMLFQLHGALSPTKEVLRFHEENDGEHFSLNYAVKAGALIFVPFTQSVYLGTRGVKRCREKSPADAALPLLRVKKTDLNAEPMYVTLDACTGPFWKFLKEQQHQSQEVPNLMYKILKTQGSQTGAVQMNVQGKVVKKSSKLSLELHYPVLTNEEDLPAFTVLRAAESSRMPSVKDM